MATFVNDIPLVVLVLPNGPEMIQLVNRHLIQNAKRGQDPNLSLPSLRTLATHIVNEDAVIPITEGLSNVS